MEKKKGIRISAFVLVFVLLIVASIGMWAYGTDWGYVKVERIKIIGDDGLTYSALLYVPENATNATPAPAFMGQHGRSSNARDMQPWAIEMARRGYVVLLPDAAGGGESERFEENYINGPVDFFFQYLTGLPIVQADQICIAGISQGTDSTAFIGVKYPEQVKAVCLMAPVGAAGNNVFETNVQFIFGYKDEAISLDVNGKRGSPIQHMMNSFNEAAGTTFDSYDVENVEKLVEEDKIYGSIAEGTARTYHTEPMVHAAGTFNFGAIAAMVDFFTQCTTAPRPIESDSAIWHLNEFFGLVLYFAMALFVPLCCAEIIKIPFFEKIKQPIPKCVGLPKKGWTISAVCAVVMPILVWLYVPRSTTLTNNGTALLPANHLNAIVLWMLYMTIFGIAMFFLFHFTDGKKQGGNLETYGIVVEGGTKKTLETIGRSFLVTAITVWVAFMVLYCIEELTGFAPHFWFLSYTKLVDHRLDVVPIYFVLYFVAFFMSGLGMNVERGLPSTGNETKDMIRALVINVVLASIGIFLVLLFQWFFQFNQMTYLGSAREIITLGQVNSAQTLTNNSQFGIGFLVATAAGINTYCYRKTGSVWTGTFLCALWTAFSAIMSNSLAM